LLKWAFEGRFGYAQRPSNAVKDGELPKGWKWVNLKDVAVDISDGDHQAPPKSSNGIPFITISNVNKVTRKIDFTDTFKVNINYYSGLKPNRKPQKGDVLYTVTGSFGIPILIDFDKEFCFQRHIGLIRPLRTINQKWVYYLLQSPFVFSQARDTATGTAQKTVALSSLRNFRIPFCPLSEQQLIVDELENKLTVCDKIEETIKNSLKLAETLRQSILKKAFQGKLIQNL
jgi:type I restriction enzyme S subunit